MFQLTRERLKSQSDAQTVNPFSFLLHDAVWALALAADNKDNIISLKDTICQCSDVFVYQELNVSARLVGVYSGEYGAFTITTIDVFVYDGPTLKPVQLNPYLMLLSVSCFLFNTLLLILYLCFRNHPDVKSTNVSLSLLIFIGCYLLIGFTVVEFVKYALAVDVCMVSLWLGGFSLSLPVILATVLVKMLRVYHIISLRKRWKQSVFTIYIAPVIYTLLIMSPCALILTLWTIIDPLHLVNTYVEHPGFITVGRACDGTYIFIAMACSDNYLPNFSLLDCCVHRH